MDLGGRVKDYFEDKWCVPAWDPGTPLNAADFAALKSENDLLREALRDVLAYVRMWGYEPMEMDEWAVLAGVPT
jgi:hypothetical protein